MRHAIDLAGVTLACTLVVLLLACGYAWGIASAESREVCIITPADHGYVFAEAAR